MTPELPMTLGFAFSPDANNVVLINKLRGPSFNIGKWNGLGGKFKVGESARGCVSREFHEEAGVLVEPVRWATFHVESHLAREEQTLNPRLYCLTTLLTLEEFTSVHSATDECVDVFSAWGMLELGASGEGEGVYNLDYLVEMARCWHKHPEHRWIEG